MKNNRLYRRLNGFQKASRERFKILTAQILTQEEFLLYELGVAIADWDKRHVDTYQSFEATNQELGNILGWKSDSTAFRHKLSLLKKGYFIKRPDGRIIVKGFDNWVLRSHSNLQETSAKTESPLSLMQDSSANNEEFQDQKAVYPLVSSKVSLGSSRYEGYEDVTDEDLDKAIEVIGEW